MKNITTLAIIDSIDIKNCTVDLCMNMAKPRKTISLNKQVLDKLIENKRIFIGAMVNYCYEDPNYE